jgi:CheY-like chemotaxis protein
MTKTTTILKKVVFVDDDPATNQVHNMLASSMNLAEEVEIFTSGQDVLMTYHDDDNGPKLPDIFFIDIRLPRISGHELAIKLRSIKRFDPKKTAIVFLTASKDIKDLVEADDNKFEHYHWKPLDKRKMAQILRETFNIYVD